MTLELISVTFDVLTSKYHMTTIQVKSIPVDKVIADIAESLKTTVKKDCFEYSLEIPEKLGKGCIKGLDLGNGLSIINYDCTFLKDIEIQFIVNSIHPLKFLYSLEKGFIHRFEKDDELHSVEKYQNVIVASSGHNGHILNFKANSRTFINSLEITRSYFQEKMKCELESLQDELKEVFEDTLAKKQFYYKGYYSLQISNLFNETIAYKEGSFLRKILWESVAYNMLGMEIQQYQDAIKKEGDISKGLLSRIEVKLIEDATILIRSEISDLGTIAYISRQVGLNVNKLQDGFQKMYRLSVNGYIQQVRLELAIYLLVSTDIAIFEIAEKIGLNSKSYFSKVFKETYGISPLQFRKNNLVLHKKMNQKPREIE